MFGHDDDNSHKDPDLSAGFPPAENGDDASPAFTAGSPLQDSKPVEPAKPAGPPSPAGHATDSASGDDDLLGIKQSALTLLTPLVGHLEQTPEEKFRTTMMMIQAADNKALIKDAYEAAQAITDEKTKAQALLDIVNEINYFTQHDAK
jgi:hypothetical protein